MNFEPPQGFERSVAIDSLNDLNRLRFGKRWWNSDLNPANAVEPLELLELAFSDDGLNEAKRLNDLNGWNGLIAVMNEAKRLNPSIRLRAVWNDWNWLLHT